MFMNYRVNLDLMGGAQRVIFLVFSSLTALISLAAADGGNNRISACGTYSITLTVAADSETVRTISSHLIS